MAYLIRTAVATDASAISELANQFIDYLRSLGDTAVFNLTEAAILRDGFGEQPAFKGLVAIQGGAVVGYLLYHFGYDADNAARNMHIIDLYVHPLARNLGIGRSLMAAAAKLCREAHGTDLFWSVYMPNTPAMAFYEGIGARYTQDLVFMKINADQL